MSPKELRFAELANGRAAMLGCSVIGLTALASKAGLAAALVGANLQAIWWSLGIYAN